MNDDVWVKLRKPFPAEQIGHLPRGGTQLDYVGHADVTSRLLEADPAWSWEPLASDENGLPRFDLDDKGRPVGLWIQLTAGGVTRLGYGSCPSGQSDAVKVLIGDALRNSAMRFGVALDLWAKGDRADPTAENPSGSAGHAHRGGQSAGDVFENSRPAPSRQNDAPRGQVARPVVQAAPDPDAEIDPEAQALADDAHTCRSVTELRTRTYTTAHQRGKLTAFVADPATGMKGQLGPYLNFRKKVLEDLDAAWKELNAAAGRRRTNIAELENELKIKIGVDVEAATAAQIREFIASLGKAAA